MIGTAVSEALALAGVDEARVSAWLGRPCGCAERREKLDALGWWAARVVRNAARLARMGTAARELDGLMGADDGGEVLQDGGQVPVVRGRSP